MTIDIKQIIEIAARGMSGDNAQPWWFQWDGNCLQVYHDSFRGRHFLNSSNHLSILSLGTVAELIAIAASLQGYEANILDLPNLGVDNHKPWFRVSFKKNPQSTSYTTREDVFLRRTCRGVFAGGSLATPLFDKIAESFHDLPEIRFSKTSNISKEFKELNIRCDQFIWKNENCVRDMLSWFRLDNKESKVSDGMFWKELGIKSHELITLRLMRRFPELAKFFYYGGLKYILRQVAHRNLGSSAGLCCLSLSETSNKAIFNLGRASMRLSLLLLKDSYVTQPISSMAVTVLDFKTGAFNPNFSKNFFKILPRVEKCLRETFSLEAHETPGWVVRTGILHTIDKVAQSKRRPVENLLMIHDVDSIKS
ncbi:MAG TPA: hypothetical protein VN132_11210 [Bdellovibrio sp.]|nr:hypothetical protein [Bdellovibrio sp.]